MKSKLFLICITLLCSCGAMQHVSGSKANKKAIKIASAFLQTDSPEYYNKYCRNQIPFVETRTIEAGKYKGLGIQIVTYNYPLDAKTENPMFIDYAVKVYINSNTGQVITKLSGPDGIGKVYENELFQEFSPNILKLTK